MNPEAKTVRGKPNIGPLHPGCAMERLALYQGSRHTYEVGDAVKSRHVPPDEPDEPGEWMWSEVKEVHEDHIIGRLDNDPLELTHVKWNDTVRIPLTGICEHLSKAFLE